MSEADRHIQELMNDALDGHLSPEGMRRLEGMLRADSARRAEWESMKRLSQMLRAVDAPRVPEDFARRIRERIEATSPAASSSEFPSRPLISHSDSEMREPTLFERLGLVRVAAVFLAFIAAGTILYEEMRSRPLTLEGTEATAPPDRRSDGKTQSDSENDASAHEKSKESPGQEASPATASAKKMADATSLEDKRGWSGPPTKGAGEELQEGENATELGATGRPFGRGAPGRRMQREAPALLRLDLVPDSGVEEARLLSFARRSPAGTWANPQGTLISSLPAGGAVPRDSLELLAGKLSELRVEEILSPAFAQIAAYQEEVLAIQEKLRAAGPGTGEGAGAPSPGEVPRGVKTMPGVPDRFRSASGVFESDASAVVVPIEPSVYLVRGSGAPALVETLLGKAPEPPSLVRSEPPAFAFFSIKVQPSEATAVLSSLESEPGLSVRSLGGTWPTFRGPTGGSVPGAAVSADRPSDGPENGEEFRVLLVVLDS